MVMATLNLLRLYFNYADPLIKVKASVHWPDGTYALPRPTWGCPQGWHSGYTLQHTEKHNKKSRGLRSKMVVDVHRNRIRFHYCVKRSNKNNDIQWPKGTYCIAKKGKCPRGFWKGGIHWDDYNYFNKNWKWGELPDGRYNRDTTVDYCCRSDGNHRSPIDLPTDKPFVLYRYGGHCQRVRGMRYTQLYIKWNDSNIFNRDKCWGRHPDATCRHDQVLHFCYYYKYRLL